VSVIGNMMETIQRKGLVQVCILLFAVLTAIYFYDREEIPLVYILVFGIMFTVLVLKDYKNSIFGFIFLLPFQLKGCSSGYGVVSITDIAVVLLALGFLKEFLFRKKRIIIPVSGIFIVFFILVSIISLVMNYNLIYLKHFIRFIVVLTAVYLISLELRGKSDLLELFENLVFTIFFLSILVIFESIVIRNSFLLFVHPAFGEQYRAVSVFNQPNYTALFIAFFLPLSLLLYKNRKSKFYIAVFILCCISIILTFSRAGLILLFLQFLVLPLARSFKFFLVFSVIILIVGFPEFLLTRKYSVDQRWERISESVQIFKQSPIIGTGPGSYSDNLEKMFPDKNYVSPGSHNLYLKIAVETGIMGFLCFALFLFMIFFKVLIETKRNVNARAIYFALFVVFVFSQNFFATFVSLPYWLVAAILMKIHTTVQLVSLDNFGQNSI